MLFITSNIRFKEGNTHIIDFVRLCSIALSLRVEKVDTNLPEECT